MTSPATASRALEIPSAPPRADPLRLALAAVLLTYVWRVQDLVPGLTAARIPTLVTLALGATLLIDRGITTRLAVLQFHPVWKPLPWFVLMGGISAAVSIAPRLSVDFFVRSFLPTIALGALLPAAIRSARDAIAFCALHVAGALLYCVAVFVRFDVDAGGRLGSLVFYDANDIGMLLVCTLPLCAWFARHARHPLSRALAVGAALTFLVTIARTGSRGAFIGLIAVGAYLALRMRAVSAGTRLAVVVAAIAALLIGAGSRYRAMMSTLAHPTEDYNWVGRGDGGRMNIWERGLGYAADHPVAGVGLWAFPVAEGTLSPLASRQEYSRGVKWSAAHNSFVQVLAELGVPGFLIFMTMIVAAFRCAARLARDCARAGPAWDGAASLASAHAATLIGFCVSGFFLSQAYGAYLYVVVGMIVGLDSVVRVSRPPSPGPARTTPPRP